MPRSAPTFPILSITYCWESLAKASVTRRSWPAYWENAKPVSNKLRRSLAIRVALTVVVCNPYTDIMWVFHLDLFACLFRLLGRLNSSDLEVPLHVVDTGVDYTEHVDEENECEVDCGEGRQINHASKLVVVDESI